MKNIAIIGGYGQMGQLFTKLLKPNNNIIQIGINNWHDLSVNSLDMVIVCVPIDITLDVITKVANLISDNTILADFTSIKESPLAHMLKVHKGPVLALHPMFGPTIVSTTNQVIINCGGRDIEQSQWFIDALISIGFSIKNMSASDHDLAMDFIQGIEHFSTFILGSFLKEHEQHPDKLFNLASPIYQAKLVLMGRIFDQDPNLYKDIITASNIRINLIEKYVDYCNSWINKLKFNNELFIQQFSETAAWMGDFTHKAQLASEQFLTEVNKKNLFNKP